MKNILLVILILWGIPSTYFRSKFRKIIYQTNDWKINIKPLFKKELIGLFSNILPNNKDYIKKAPKDIVLNDKLLLNDLRIEQTKLKSIVSSIN